MNFTKNILINKNIKIFVNILVMLLNSNLFFANTYYVSMLGNDKSKGTYSHPLKTIQFGINKLIEGDTLFIRGGIYNETLTLQNKKFKIKTVITNFNNELVEIRNLKKIESFVIQNNKLICPIKDKVYDVFLNGKNQKICSYPNRLENKINYNLGINSYADTNGKIVLNDYTDFEIDKFTILSGLFGQKIVSIVDTIKNKYLNNLFLDNNAWFWKFKDYIDSGKVLLLNNIKFLDNAEEWYWDTNNLHLILSDTNDVKNLTLEIRTEKYVIDLSNSDNLEINGLSFFSGKLNLKNCNNVKLNNCIIKFACPFFTFKSGFEKYIPIDSEPKKPDELNGNEPDWTILNSPENWNGNSIELSGRNNSIENCYIAHTWGDGLTIWGEGHKIKNNIITDFNWIGNDCSGISIAGKNHEVSHNEISYGGRSLITHSYIMNSKILNNHIHHGGLICNDQGLTYAFWTDGQKTEIAYNYLHDNLGKNNNVGIYLDNWTYNFIVHHNVINNTGTGLNINSPNNNHVIYNNTLFGNKYSMGSWPKDDIKNIKTFNNITNTNKKERWNYDAFYGTKMDSNHVYFDNDIFIDPENHNFSLKKYSYPIDKGVTNEYTLPFKGKAPDLGAIESDSEPFEYGSSIIVENEQHYPPKAPLKLKLINNTPTTTVLAWEYPFNFIDSFYLERKISGDTFKIIAKLQALTLNYNDSNQPPGEYRYRVKALNKYGISDPSNSVEIFNPKYENSLFLDAENNDRNNGTNKSGDVIINNDNNDWVCFKQVDYGTQNFDACIVNMAVPCEQSWQEIQLRIDRPMGRMIGNLTTTSTGGWDKFEQRTFPIEKIRGKHDTYIKFKGNQGLGTIDWFNLYNSQGNIKKQYPTDPICPQQRITSRLIPITIYPNPSSEELAVAIENLETSDINIKFASTEGILLLDKTETKQQPGTQEYYLHNHINISSLTKGIYHLQITITGKRITQTKNYKFIKN